MRKILTRFTATWAVTSARFARLSKRAKILVASQLLILTLLFGASAKSAIVRFSGPPTSSKAPIEIPYSTFMDFCEAKDKKPKPTEPAVHIGNVVIGSEKIGYQLMRVDTEEQHAALESVTKGEKSDVEIPQRTAYTRKVSASPELISFLRQNEIPFRAASSKGTTAAAMTVRYLILAFYALLMIRMYRTMSGGGGSSGTPGKLATSDLPLVSFEDIEGIDDAKFEVMELVDTLRNPGKYAILGARAPTGLLLEGPPGTGKTMLARATAATAGVPLLYCSGSDFVEMFVGTWASSIAAKASLLVPYLLLMIKL